MEVSIGQLSYGIEIKCIQFAEWLSGLGYQQYDGKDRWISQEESGNKVFTTKELYQRFSFNPKI